MVEQGSTLWGVVNFWWQIHEQVGAMQGSASSYFEACHGDYVPHAMLVASRTFVRVLCKHPSSALYRVGPLISELGDLQVPRTLL